MKTRLTTFSIFLAALTVILCAPLFASEGVPAHPRELIFKDRAYTPPKAADYRHVLSNGAVVYMAEDHDFPLVDISVTIRTGQYLDPPDKIGLASMTGSQIRSGGTAKMRAEDFDEEVEFLAANISSAIGDTQGSAGAGFLAKDTDHVLDLLFDMLRNPAFQQDRLDLAKARTLQFMKRRNDSTPGIEAREWNRLMRGPDHFTSKETTKASIDAITRDDLVAFHKRFYHPKNMILAVAGDFKSDEMLAKLEKRMAGWEGTTEKVADVPKSDFKPKPGIYFVNKPTVNQGRVAIGHLGALRTNPDRYALTVMNDILGGGGFTSRIMSRVRSDEGLAYSAGSRYGLGIYYEGEFRAGFQSKSPSCAQAAKIVLDEIARIRTDDVTKEELDTAVQSFVESFPQTFSTAAKKVSTFAEDEYTGRDPNYWAEYRKGIQSVTPADVKRVAQKYLHPDELVILVVGNADDILKGNPDKQDYDFKKLMPKAGEIVRIPLPDPMTMVYP